MKNGEVKMDGADTRHTQPMTSAEYLDSLRDGREVYKASFLATLGANAEFYAPYH